MSTRPFELVLVEICSVWITDVRARCPWREERDRRWVERLTPTCGQHRATRKQIRPTSRRGSNGREWLLETRDMPSAHKSRCKQEQSSSYAYRAIEHCTHLWAMLRGALGGLHAAGDKIVGSRHVPRQAIGLHRQLAQLRSVFTPII